MRILIVTDAWHPQVNGVVRTLERVADEVRAMGHDVLFLTPDMFRTIPMPTYPEIRLAMTPPGAVAVRIKKFAPDHLHIATEGPLGQAARRACLNRRWSFTTSYHTRFPEYLRARLPVPESWSYAFLRRFHNAGRGTLVATRSLARELEGRGFNKVRLWTRGVDSEMFRPREKRVLDLPGPIFLSVGRVAVEKNLEAFLSLDLPGTKVVVGEGPALDMLKTRYPAAVFLGKKTGEELAEIFSSADVFVFPSLTDTFGIVILEALASGVPVAAYPVTGPIDVLHGTKAGALDHDLRVAALAALELKREDARALALEHSWQECARIFIREMEMAKEGPQAETAPQTA
ncbi:glycosyltransferase family 4 protein [Flaviflagellibacter deserti]|uniref:Glycosyltransferase family 4 protein n=1 Tax=Flaviflagellibacter deserti TaxID=2267266 RepID=A0ABV9Z5U3_9HYPH